MSKCEDLEMKYLIETSTGIKILINRAGQKYQKELSFRKNGGREKTILMARKIRDQVHLDLFGIKIRTGFNHVCKKKNTLNPELPPGISLGFSRGKLLYVVVNYMKNGRATRKRFNIKKLTYETALMRAISFRENIIKSTE